MRFKVVGSAAGGGFPQWNSNDRLSRAVRSGAPGVRERTQSSLIASADGRNWVLFNASPDIRQQIAATPELHPASDGPARDSPIRAVVLTNADVDHVAGLLGLRERQPFALYAAPRVLSALAANPVFNVLDPAIVPRRPLQAGRFEVADAEGRGMDVWIDAFPVPGKVALYLEDAGRPDLDYGSEDGDTIGFRIEAGRAGALCYVPGCARVDDALKARLHGAAVLLFDGTLYTDDEMVKAGVGTKTGKRMGHISMSGPDGAIAALAQVAIGRRIFVHVNNTNPVLDEASPEHAAVREAGWEIAHDGLEIAL
ncbi:MAG: pyrroloquinoline quinone biosynthesis protein PqqB [Mesorhizobium sp.]